MNLKAAITVTACLIVATGCGRVHHTFRPNQPAGTALPVEVTVKHKADQMVSGTVYHRMTGMTAFDSARMQPRAGQLYALLPTQDSLPLDTCEYYIDVNRDGKMFALGSPGSPYVVTFLDQEEMILSNLNDRPIASDAGHEVRIVLEARNQPIDQPYAVYRMPGVPGNIRTPMESDGYGNYQVIVPPHAVRPGTWRYAIEVPLNGSTYRIPKQGYRSFTVDRLHRQVTTAEPAVN